MDVVFQTGKNNKTISASRSSLRGGVNRRDHPQRIGLDQAVKIENYLVEADGRAKTRPGFRTLEKVDVVYVLTGISGTYLKDEIVTGTGGSATVVTFYSTYLYVKNPTADLSGTLTGGTSGATGTFSALRKNLTTSMSQPLGTDTIVVAFDDATVTHLGKYKISTETLTFFKTFSTTNASEGIEYNKFFAVVNQAEKVGYFHETGRFLDFDAQGSNFTIGETLTGGTSGATGILLLQNDSGPSGTLLLNSITGTFQDNETITSSGGSATVNGTIYDWYTIPDNNAPKAKHITVYERSGRGAHLVVANTSVNPSLIAGSEEYTNADILTFPFLDWGVGSPPIDGDAFATPFASGGSIQSIKSDADKVLVQSERASGAFHIERIDVDGVGSSQLIVTDSAERNFGGFNALFTKYGITNGSTRGIFQSNFVQGDKVDSDATNIIGEDEISDSNFDNVKFVYDGKNRIFCFYKHDATRNNFGLAINYLEDGFGQITGRIITDITGMSLNDCSRIGEDLYGVSSAGFVLYQIFTGTDDDGTDLNTRLELGQIDGGNPLMIKIGRELYAQMKLNALSVVKLEVKTWDNNNNLRAADSLYYFLVGNSVNEVSFGYSVTPYNELLEHGTIIRGENLFHTNFSADQFLKYQFILKSSDQVGHEFHFITAFTEDIYMTKPNNMVSQSSAVFLTEGGDSDSSIYLIE